MQLDPILQHFFWLVVFLETLQNSTLIFLHTTYSKVKDSKITYEGYVIRDPSFFNKDFSNSKTLYMRLAWTTGVILIAALILNSALHSQNPSNFIISAIQFVFGVLAFSTIQKTIGALVLWFQLKNSTEKSMISGGIKFSRAYLLQQSAFTSFLYSLAVGFFAAITHNEYLIGGAFILLVFTLRDWFGYKRLSRKAP